jgi:predicted lipoprotein with Yx(FWY)xxD motif
MTSPLLGTRARILSWAAVATIALGACSAAATPVPPTPAPTAAPATAAPATDAPATASPATSPSASPSEAAASPETYTLTVVNGAAALGKYMTGDDGMTLYTFKKDTASSGTSACTGSCATNWPPFTLDDGDKAVGGDGAAGTIATIKRDDGKDQVTYNGAPLYYFKGDSKAGDTNGQGVGGIWFVAAP